MKIAIIGSAGSSIRQGPYLDRSFAEFQQGSPQLEPFRFPYIEDDWQIRACSPGTFGVIARCTEFYELHRWEPGRPWFSPEYCNWLRNFKGTVWTGEVIPEIHNSKRLPRELLVAEFGPYFLTSSISIMIGMAILDIQESRRQYAAKREVAERAFNGAQERGDQAAMMALAPFLAAQPEKDAIGLWGVDMAATEEYGYQRAGCQFFFMEADRRGIDVILPPESDVSKPMPVYGVCEWNHAWVKGTARQVELRERMSGVEQMLSAKTAELHFLKGAVESNTYWLQTWVLTEHTATLPVDDTGKQEVTLTGISKPISTAVGATAGAGPQSTSGPVEVTQADIDSSAKLEASQTMERAATAPGSAVPAGAPTKRAPNLKSVSRETKPQRARARSK